MDLRKRLFRRPVRTIIWQIVLITMALLVGVSGALGYASNRLIALLDEHHTTIAAQTYYENRTDYGGVPHMYLRESDIEVLENLDMVEMVDLRTLTGAYIPSITADIALAKWGDLHQMNWDYAYERGLNDPYNQIVVTGTVTEAWTIDENDRGVDLTVLGKGNDVKVKYAYCILEVDEILVMNEEYDIFPTEEWSSYNGSVFVQALFYDETGEDYFQEGERYIVSGSYDPSAHGMGISVRHTPAGVPLPWIEVNSAFYSSRFTYCFAETDRLIVYQDSETQSPDDWEDPDSVEVLLRAEDPLAVVQKLEGTTEDFLEAHPQWQERVKLLEMAQHTFPVLGTECLESMQYFVTSAATITEGRTFTREEYDSGAKVCVISETMAQSGGIKAGDTISVSQYLLGKNYEEGNRKSPLEPFADGEANEPNVGVLPIPNGLATENEEFTVVGIYRLERSWDNNAFAFTPNTMFVPQKAQIPGGIGGPSYDEVVTGMVTFTDLQTGETWEDETTWVNTYANGSYGVYMSIKLKNGTMEEFQEAIAQTRLATQQFLTYDQGYEGMKENVDAVIAAANRLFVMAAAVWLLLLLLYILLYQAREKRNLGIMRSVGAQPGRARRYLFASGFLPAVVGIGIGTALSSYVTRLVQDKLIGLTLTQAQSSAHSGGMELDNTMLAQMLGESEMTAAGLLILALAQIVVIAVFLWCHAALLAKKNSRKLLGV